MAARVLIVDDEPNIVTSLEFLMRASDFEVRSTGSGEEALALLESFQPHVVLLDVMLPGVDGFAICRAIRGRESAGPKVVMLTARGRAVDLEAARQAGADAYVVKPFSTREVISTVKGLLA